MSKKGIFTSLLVGAIILFLGIIILDGGNKKITSENPIFYYSNSCPHCLETEKWMTENKIEKKITIIKKEISENIANNNELIQAAANCGISSDKIGVPFLYADKKCFIGSPDVEAYLAKKTGIENLKTK